MPNPTRRTAFTFLALLLGFLSACDGVARDHDPIGPGRAPSFAESESEEDGELVTEEGYTGPTRAAAWIGSAGGSLSLASHSLTVPEGAIQGDLCFTMELGSGSVVDVDLNAWEMDSSEECKVEGDGWEGNLWKGDFDVPVALALTYSRANNVSDPADLVVAWVKSATDILPLSSSVDTASETVSSELDHFSEYALFIP